MTAWLVGLTIGLPWLGALIVWRIPDHYPQRQHGIAVIASLLTAAVSIGLLTAHSTEVALRLHIGGIFGDFILVPDGLGVLLAAIAAIIGSLTVIFSVAYMEHEACLNRYYALVLIFIGTMAGLGLAGNLLLMFFFWEITALCSYALIAFDHDNPAAVAGGLKALVITQLGGIGLLIGALTAYGRFGTDEIAVLLARAETLPKTELNLIAFSFLIAAMAKSAQVPFHSWLPGAMEAPTPISALIHAATMVNAGVYLLARFYPAFEDVTGWTTAVMTVGIVSALMAALMALVANDLKRVLAYSTISQLGYMVFAVGAGGIFASQFHLLSHAVFKALLFLGAGAVIHSVGTRDIRQMGGLWRSMPQVTIAFVIGAMALVGIPGMNGFWSKELILERGLDEASPVFVVGLLIGVGLTALYTLRLVWLVFAGTPRFSAQVHEAPSAMRISLGILAVGSLTTWLLASPLSKMLAETLPYHHLHSETTRDVISDVMAAPITALALVCVALGFLLWGLHDRLGWLIARLQLLSQIASQDFGFEALNRAVMRSTSTLAERLRSTQTGELNWNIWGIVAGLVAILIYVAVEV
ncbi:MAG: NADH-quinone oxidoreductase subunit L [Anaerolineae bacterium]|nr:NADH-quinone oxidoreductase subunit L [Anaerolineae bacterium]